jgi:hypothetical protein
MKHVSIAIGFLATASAMAFLALSGCNSSGGNGITGGANDRVTLTLGSQQLTLSHVQQGYDSGTHTTSMNADDGSAGMMGPHRMVMSFPGNSTGTWTQDQGCQFGMNSGSGMMSSTDITVTCTNYPGIGGDMMGTLSGHLGGQPVTGTFIVKRTQ